MTGLTVFDPFRNLTVGFDDVFNRLSSLNHFEIPKYPPYNIKKIDDSKYQLEIALAGFSREDIDVQVNDYFLFMGVVGGKSRKKPYYEDGGFKFEINVQLIIILLIMI